MSSLPVYRVWDGMKGRCLNPNHVSYVRYGGRGIKICREWMISSNFVKWALSHGYKRGLLLDRRNNNLRGRGYSPENCRWVTRKQQMRNTRHNRVIKLNGREMPMVAWLETPAVQKLGLVDSTVAQRLDLGWSARKSLTTPPGPRGGKFMLLRWRGESHSLRQWARIVGIASHTLLARFARGWSVEKALTTPKLVKDYKRCARRKRSLARQR